MPNDSQSDRIVPDPQRTECADGVTPSTVFVASDARLYSEGLALVFAADGRLHVSQVADSAERAVLFFRDAGADVLLLDAGMRRARFVLETVAARLPNLPVVMFGVAELSDDLALFLEASGTVFVSRDASSKELILTLLGTIQGDALPAHSSRARLYDRATPLQVYSEVPPFTGALTARERELAALLDEGLSNKEIAQRLNISVATVKNHVHHILEKLHIERRGQAASRLRQPMNLKI